MAVQLLLVFNFFIHKQWYTNDTWNQYYSNVVGICFTASTVVFWLNSNIKTGFWISKNERNQFKTGSYTCPCGSKIVFGELLTCEVQTKETYSHFTVLYSQYKVNTGPYMLNILIYYLFQIYSKVQIIRHFDLY